MTGPGRQSGPLTRFFAHEAAGGILLMLAALAAMFLANSPLGTAYQQLFEVKLTVKIGDFYQGSLIRTHGPNRAFRWR